MAHPVKLCGFPDLRTRNEEFRRLHNLGYTDKQIGQHLKCSYKTVSRAISELHEQGYKVQYKQNPVGRPKPPLLPLMEPAERSIAKREPSAKFQMRYGDDGVPMLPSDPSAGYRDKPTREEYNEAKRNKTAERMLRMYNLFKLGYTYDQVRDELGITKNTLAAWMYKMRNFGWELPAPPRGPRPKAYRSPENAEEGVGDTPSGVA